MVNDTFRFLSLSLSVSFSFSYIYILISLPSSPSLFVSLSKVQRGKLWMIELGIISVRYFLSTERSVHGEKERGRKRERMIHRRIEDTIVTSSTLPQHLTFPSETRWPHSHPLTSCSTFLRQSLTHFPFSRQQLFIEWIFYDSLEFEKCRPNRARTRISMLEFINSLPSCFSHSLSFVSFLSPLLSKVWNPNFGLWKKCSLLMIVCHETTFVSRWFMHFIL